MVIGTLALLWYFVMVAVVGAGQRLRREPEETKSCRTGEICTSICTSGPEQGGPALRDLGPPLRGLGQPLRGRGGDGCTDRHMHGRTYGQISPVLQDFVSSGSLRSRCPKRTLRRIIVWRAETDLNRIKETFKRLYGRSLASDVWYETHDETSDYFRKTRLALLRSRIE